MPPLSCPSLGGQRDDSDTCSFCLPLILPPRCWYSSIRGEGNGKLTAIAASPISLLNYPLRERKIWRLILLRRYRQLGRNVFWLTSIRHVLTFYCIWCRIIITESSVSDSIVNGVLIHYSIEQCGYIIHYANCHSPNWYMLIILRSLIIGILLCCHLLINTDITYTRNVMYLFFSTVIASSHLPAQYCFYIFNWYIFRISCTDEWFFPSWLKATGMQFVEKLHLAPSSPASVEITEWRQDPSRLVKEHGPQSFTWVSTPVLNALLKYHCSAIYLVKCSFCNLSPCRFGLPFFIQAFLICYEFNQVCDLWICYAR